MRRDIVNRKTINGKRIRELECGHDQAEPSGGKSHLALSSRCDQCVEEWEQAVQLIKERLESAEKCTNEN